MKKPSPKKDSSEKKTTASKKTAPATGFWSNTTNLINLAGLIVVTLIVFSGSLSNDFVNWDDPDNLLKNPNLLVFNWTYIKQIFTTPVIGNYNPLPIFTFAIEHHYFGFDPFVYHLDNLVLHLICVYFVYRILVALQLSPVASLIGALIFAIHPMRVESVAWVTERKDVLFGTFYLAAIFLYIKNKANASWLNVIGIAVLFVLALFSKIQAVSLPLTLLVLDYYIDKKLSWKIILQKAPYFLLSLAFGVGGLYFLKQQESLQQLTSYGIGERLLIGSLSYILYLVKFIAPYRMSPLYPYESDLSWDFYAAPVAVLAVVALCVWAYRKNWYWLLTGLGIYTVNVIFLLQVLGAGQGLFADRFTYIPYLGLIFMVCFVIDYVRQSYPDRSTALFGLATIYLLIFAALSRQQTTIWENSEKLWTHVIKYYPKTPTPWLQRARYYRDNKQNNLALSDLNQAYALKADRDKVFLTRAKLYFDAGKMPEAIVDYDSAEIYNPEVGELYINRGAALGATGKFKEGIEDIKKGLTLKNDFAAKTNGLQNLGLLYYKDGQYEKSIETYDQLLAIDPTRINLWYEKGLCKRAEGKQEEAITFLDKAIQLDPTKGLYYNERAMAYLTLGNKKNGAADVATAERLGVTIDPRVREYLKK